MVQTYGLHSRLEYVILLLLGILGIDQFSKFLAQQFLPIKYVLIEHVLWLTYVENFGAGFGIFTGASLYLGIIGVIISIILLVVIFTHKLSFLENTAYTLIIAGALGNAIDRFVFGYVIDFIDFGWWPVFNIADISLVVGVGLILIQTFKEKNDSKGSSPKKKGSPSTKKNNAFKLETYE